MAKVFVSRLAVPGGELVGEGFSSDPVDGAGEVVVRDGGVPVEVAILCFNLDLRLVMGPLKSLAA